jgi:hypothetical protein
MTPYETVADKPCTLSPEGLQGLIEFLERMPAHLESLLVRLSESQLRHKPGPEADAFSLVEQVHHLRDIEVEGYSHRLRRMLAEDNPVLPDIDGTRLAVERAYNQKPLAPAFDEFVAARRANIELLRRLSPADLSRTGKMEGVGSITLAQLLEMWRNHDSAHRAELQELLAVVKRL